MENKQLRESTDKISPEYADFQVHEDVSKFTEAIKKLIGFRPTTAKQHQKYIDLETGELWTMHNKSWVNKGDPVPTLRHKMEVDAKKKNKPATTKKVTPKKTAKSKQIIITPAPAPTQPDAFLLKNPTLDNPLPPKDDGIDDDILNKIKESTDPVKYPEPDDKLIVGNRFYFVVDITPSRNGDKFSHEFIDFICRYFTGTTIYLVGDNSSYTQDHFMKKRPNVMRLPKCDQKTFLSYIVYARRYYTFREDYIEYALEHNINGITLFLPTGDKGIVEEIKGVDYHYLDKNVDISIIPENKGNVLKY